MAEDLQQLFDLVDGEGPSPDFVAQLQERLIAEEARIAADDQGSLLLTSEEPPIEINLDDPRPEPAEQSSRWALIALVAAAIAIVLGLSSLLADRSEGGLETIDEPDQVTTSVAPTTIAPQTTTTENPTTTAASPPVFDPAATPLAQEFQLLEEQRYLVTSVGTPFSFTVDQPLWVQTNIGALLALSDPTSSGPGDEALEFTRASRLWDPSDLTAGIDEIGDGWPVSDFDGWLDIVTESFADLVTVSDRRDVLLGSTDATVVDLKIGSTGCSLKLSRCVGFFTNNGADMQGFDAGYLYRVWFVPQASEDPVVAIAAISHERDLDWFDRADQVMATVAFGDPASNPILDVTAGSVGLPLLGGVRIDIEDSELVLLEEVDSSGEIYVDGEHGSTEMISNPTDLDGNLLATADDLIALLGEAGLDVEELEGGVVGGIPTRLFDVFGFTPDPILLRHESEVFGWRSSTANRLWLIPHPERGLLVVTAWAFENVETSFPRSVARTERILGSLEFISLE